MPLRVEQKEPTIEKPKPVAEIPVKSNEQPDWEKRRFELVEKLILQGRLSVILGKTKETDGQIAAKSRRMADAAIRELQTHPYKSYEDDRGREKDAGRGDE